MSKMQAAGGRVAGEDARTVVGTCTRAGRSGGGVIGRIDVEQIEQRGLHHGRLL
ncbi:MAG: hypothetical protein ACOC0P_05580 [Planctomycetota bacterium]